MASEFAAIYQCEGGLCLFDLGLELFMNFGVVEWNAFIVGVLVVFRFVGAFEFNVLMNYVRAKFRV